MRRVIGWAVLAVIASTLMLCAPAVARPHHHWAPAARIGVREDSAQALLRGGLVHLSVSLPARRARVRLTIAGKRVFSRTVKLGRRHRRALAVRIPGALRNPLRAALARCQSVPMVASARARRLRRRLARRLRSDGGCRKTGGFQLPGERPQGGGAGGAELRVGAAVGDFTPPAHGALSTDRADCAGPASVLYDGRRQWAFEEPYRDLKGSGHFDAGDPYLDCNGNGRWDGNLIGGGGSSPRFYTKVLDPVTARALVVSSGQRTIAVEVVDQEGLFNVYQDRIRAKVAADGYRLDGIFISATHDESAPDSLGLYGVDSTTSSVNAYFIDFMVERSATAIERAYDGRRPATVRYAETGEPDNLRQCWSSYPYVDNRRMPVLQAVGRDGATIATLASVSQHAETLGFNPPARGEETAISADWPYFFRTALEGRYGGVAIEMAGSVGSVESPQVFSGLVSPTPQRFIDADHPAGCRTLFESAGSQVGLGYQFETRAFGEQLAGAVAQALGSATPSRSGVVAGAHSDICVPVDNQLFRAGAAAGIFAERPTYTGNCTVAVPPAPNGSTYGTELRSEVAAFRIGDGEFISVPGEVFPFTFLRGFQGPQDMPYPQYGMPAWPLPHMRAPYRFVDGLGEDMIGYVFPQGNGVGVPGEHPDTNPQANADDRFGCHHSDDSEAASSRAADIIGSALTGLLDAANGPAESQTTGRYVLGDGSLSRDPLGGPELKCSVDSTFHAAPVAAAVELPSGKIVHPAAWMSLSGRPQGSPDRDTRGYFSGDGRRFWLDVFPDVTLP
ncbi:MAG: hypothetical protein NVSMB25_17250 [Thermoleophilaceae bacterium]